VDFASAKLQLSGSHLFASEAEVRQHRMQRKGERVDRKNFIIASLVFDIFVELNVLASEIATICWNEDLRVLAHGRNHISTRPYQGAQV
jgi:hypothetical protein